MKKNKILLLAGIINLFVSFLHLIGGQVTLIDPLIVSNLDPSPLREILGAWHMVSIVLFATSIRLLKNGWWNHVEETILVKYIGYLYILFSIPSFLVGLWYGAFVPQWVLLLPIGILALRGVKQQEHLLSLAPNN